MTTVAVVADGGGARTSRRDGPRPLEKSGAVPQQNKGLKTPVTDAAVEVHAIFFILRLVVR